MSSHDRESREGATGEPRAYAGASRRSVVHAAVWGAPAIALSASSPAAAASMPDEPAAGWAWIDATASPRIIVGTAGFTHWIRNFQLSVSPPHVATWVGGNSSVEPTVGGGGFEVGHVLSPVEGGTCTITARAVSYGEYGGTTVYATATSTVYVEPANAGTIELFEPDYSNVAKSNRADGFAELSGTLALNEGAEFPEFVSWDALEPNAADPIREGRRTLVDPDTGAFTIILPADGFPSMYPFWAGNRIAVWARGFGSAQSVWLRFV
ncbi:hypothetical protein [Leifsonia sp. EB34]|uniref:hypothetical protein n=1 Tax=Leifsonia sp. EB34 TaxID=3156303 RepID=UPI00351603FC